MKYSTEEVPSTMPRRRGLQGHLTFCILAAAMLLVPGRTTGQVSEVYDPCPETPLVVEVVFPSEAGDVVFPHKQHLNDMEIPCEDCHHETLAARLTMPHPEYFEDFWIQCATCHKESDDLACPESCSKCHHNPPADPADETLASKVVIHQSCWQCHPIGSGSEASESCSFCHGSQEAGGD